MCGRYTTANIDAFSEFYDKLYSKDWKYSASYNVAPGQEVPVVVYEGGGRKIIRPMRWGLVPHWAKDQKIGYKMINARTETAHMKPAYRIPFRKSRCLIPATGWYEWKPEPEGKQPYYILKSQQQPFTFAGMWTTWQNPDGEVLESCTILTRQATKSLKGLHDRMPVTLEPKHHEAWLCSDMEHPNHIIGVMGQYDTEFVTYRVSTYVNKPSNNDARCVEAI